MSWHAEDWFRLFGLIPQLAAVHQQAVDAGLNKDHAALATVVAGISALSTPAAPAAPQGGTQ